MQFVMRRRQDLAVDYDTHGPASFTSNAVFGKHTRTYDRPNTIHHWQLRDLLSCVEDDAGHQTLYTVCDRTTVSFDVASEQSAVVQQLMFPPTSMTVGEGFIAAGGSNSQLDVRSLDSMFSFKGSIGGSVNNAMHIAKDATGKALLFVCNNDRTIKVFALPTMDRISVIPTDTAMNYATLSPDTSRLAAVGDNNQLYVFKMGPAGWAADAHWQAGRDAGMCCAWSPAGDLLAAAFQDGLLGLWDTRSGSVVASVQHSMAARCVKFSGGPADLLAVAEHQGAAHLFDLRNMKAMQTVRPHARPYNISGLAFGRQGKELYIGMDDGGIARIDIDVNARRQFSCGQLA